MKKVSCPICNQELELEDDDKIKVCYGEGHLTLKQWQEKQERSKS